MDTKRRGFMGGVSARGVLAIAAPGSAQQRPAAPAIAPARPDPAEFEAALRARFATGDVLNWTGGNVRLRRPIVLEVLS